MSNLEKINTKIEKDRLSIEKLQTKLEEKKTKREWIKNNIEEFLNELENEEVKIKETISKKEATLEKNIEKQKQILEMENSFKNKEIEEFGEYIEVEDVDISINLFGYSDDCYDEIGFDIELSNGDIISGTTEELHYPFSTYRKHIYFDTIYEGICETEEFNIDNYSERVQRNIYEALYKETERQMRREWGNKGEMR